jgi:carbamoyl-phosphate synthase large subunit
VGESGSANAADMIEIGAVQLVVNTPRGRGPRADGAYIRTAAQLHNVPSLTTVAAARAAAAGIAEWRGHDLAVLSLQELHAGKSPERDP